MGRNVSYLAWNWGITDMGPYSPVRIDNMPFENVAYIYKIHTDVANYKASFYAIHDGSTAVAFFSERPCDYASAVANGLIRYDNISNDFDAIYVSDPAYSLKQKWDQKTNKMGYSIYFLDPGKDYYITIVPTSISYSALLQGWAGLVNTVLPNPPVACAKGCYYLFNDFRHYYYTPDPDTGAMVPSHHLDLDVNNPWPAGL